VNEDDGIPPTGAFVMKANIAGFLQGHRNLSVDASARDIAIVSRGLPRCHPPHANIHQNRRRPDRAVYPESGKRTQVSGRNNKARCRPHRLHIHPPREHPEILFSRLFRGNQQVSRASSRDTALSFATPMTSG